MESDFKLDEIKDKIKKIKKDLIHLEIPLLYERLPSLTDDTKKIIYRFVFWISQKKIAIESLNHWEMGSILRIFARQEVNMHLTKGMKEILRVVIIGSEKWLNIKQKQEEKDEFGVVIKQLERELYFLKMQENCNFYIPFVEIPSLTEETIERIYNFAYWLNLKKIALESLNQWEMGFIGKVFVREEIKIGLSKKMNETLREIILKSNKWNRLKKN